MGLAKYAEDNLEIFYERMAAIEQSIRQNCKAQYNTAKTADTENKQKKGADAFHAMFADESCFF